MTAPLTTPRLDIDRITQRRRLRRNRRTDWSRRLVRETTLTVNDLTNNLLRAASGSPATITFTVNPG